MINIPIHIITAGERNEQCHSSCAFLDRSSGEGFCLLFSEELDLANRDRPYDLTYLRDTKCERLHDPDEDEDET